MANKAISELPQALNVNNQDLFVLEQSGIAKKLPAETFITEQGIIDALAEALDGHGGIQSVTLSSVSGRIRTYRITFSDGSATTFQVYDGTSIDRISRTSSSGLDDVYTVFLSDGTTTFFTVHNGADGTVSEEMLNDALKDKAPAITETTESSAIANFTDGADDMVMHHVIAEINPVQSGSGDPSPSNIRPITGWTGCNVTRTGKNLIDDSVKMYFMGNVHFAESQIGTTAVLPSGTYTFSVVTADGTVSNLYVANTDTNVDIKAVYNATTLSFTLTETTPIRLYAFKKSYTTASDITSAQLELGSTATAYEPYQGTTLTVDWQTEAGTVYGGTIDVATGLLTVDMAMVDLGTLTWQYNSGNNRFDTLIPNASRTPRGLVVANAICSAYKTISFSHLYQGQDKCLAFDQNNLRIRDTAYSDASSFKTAMNGVQLCYELETPQTYQLTPQEVLHTLYGVNNVWADTGNTTVTYTADTKMYIEKLTMPTEDDMTANQAITSGQYFMIGNSLYLALANIASGAQITIGTNAQRVSLADALNTINS